MMRPRPLFRLALLPLALAAGPAAAHQVFERSEPVAGAVLAESPPVLRIWFSDTVRPMGATLRAATREAIELPDVRSRKGVDLLDIPVPRPLPPGAYELHWQVLTTDHHPDAGVIPFTVSAP